jgi:hypothetical protein
MWCAYGGVGRRGARSGRGRVAASENIRPRVRSAVGVMGNAMITATMTVVKECEAGSTRYGLQVGSRGWRRRRERETC